MKPAENIKKLIKNLHDTTSPEMDKKTLNDTLNTLEQTTSARHKLTIGRTIMNKPITKLATAAAIILVAVLGATVLDHIAKPAYAIEQTIEAMRQTQVVHMLCRDWDGNPMELWIKLNLQSRQSEYAYLDWPKQDALIISTPEISYTYIRKANLYQITRKPILIFQIQLLETIIEGLAKQVTEIEDVGNVQVRKEYDPNFAQDVIVVCVESPKNSVRITVDPQTKLPLSIHFLRTSELGNFIKDYDRIIFDQEPPVGLFDFIIPEGATVVDQDNSDKFTNDPNFGMALDGLSRQENAELLVVKYWQDLIGFDIEELSKIWPSANNENFETVLKQFFGDNPPVELVEIRELGKEYGCPIGDVLPCIVRHQDGTLKEYKVLVGLRETDSKTSCIIYGFCGISQEID